MKKAITLAIMLTIVIGGRLSAQEIQTLFKGYQSSGGYGAISNKFTTIKGEYANLAEIYGGWFINKKFLLGLGAAASTNNLKVPDAYSAAPFTDMTWQYVQFGLMTEYVFWSNKVVHFNVSLFSGSGLTVQYERNNHDDWEDAMDNIDHDENFFFVIEPGAQLEVNVLRWLRFSPGISYRKSFGSDANGLDDNDISNLSYNVTLKVGRF
ncbi:MAG TPA: hypothetical protein VD884_15470 [Ohtaekwangia sp.]|nr:hypothetical protein [Ohtaekwangia sp.]